MDFLEISGKYTSLCDVWSYGVLIWEIFSKGGSPYHGMSNSQAREQIDKGTFVQHLDLYLIITF